MTRGARGFTIIELMTSLAVSLIVAAGAMLIIIASAKTGRITQDRSDVQRGGRAALALMSAELENAGLGLPRDLAIKSFAVDPPMLEVASLDYLREWRVLSPGSSAVTLASATPIGAGDVALAANSWMFLFNNGAAGGYGMFQLGNADRAAGGTSIPVATTTYNEAQVAGAFNLDQAATPSGNFPVVLAANVAKFGVDTTTDPNHWFLYLSEDGSSEKQPIATDVESASFRYFIDANCNGEPDDLDADGDIDNADAADSPWATRISPCEDPGGTAVQAVSVLIRLVIRSSAPDQTLGDYRRETYSNVIALRNINTRANSYTFIDNSGLKASP